MTLKSYVYKSIFCSQLELHCLVELASVMVSMFCVCYFMP